MPPTPPTLPTTPLHQPDLTGGGSVQQALRRRRRGGGSGWPQPQQRGAVQRVYKAVFLLSGPHKRDIWERRGSLNMQTSAVLLVLLAVASHTVASKCKTETCCCRHLTLFSYCRSKVERIVLLKMYLDFPLYFTDSVSVSFLSYLRQK